jgi:hypothetical protein
MGRDTFTMSIRVHVTKSQEALVNVGKVTKTLEASSIQERVDAFAYSLDNLGT